MRRMAFVTALVTMLATLVLASAGSASAANKNALALHFTCEGGITFTGNTIAQNQAHVVQGHRGRRGQHLRRDERHSRRWHCLR